MHPMAPGMPMVTHFHMVQRQAAQSWFEEPEHRGYVPPGLAKKGACRPGMRARGNVVSLCLQPWSGMPCHAHWSWCWAHRLQGTAM